MKNKRKFIPLLLAGLLIFGSSAAFAADKSGADLVKSYTFISDNPDNPKYDAPKKIKEDGKTYKLIDVEYSIIDLEKDTVKKKVTVDDPDKLADSITENGKKYTLTQASEDIEWTREPADGVIITKDYGNKNDIPATLESTKNKDGESIDIVLEKSGVRQMSKKETFNAPATFYAPAEDATSYEFNGKVVTITSGPTWSGYKNDVKAYLGLNGSDYDITGGKWSSGFKKSGDSYVRQATYTGTKTVPFYRATFTETDATASVYTATVEYQVDTGKAKMKAVAYYDRVIGMREYIMIGSGLVVLALAAAAIIFLLRRRKREEEEQY